MKHIEYATLKALGTSQAVLSAIEERDVNA